jgi:drug/metabolite transporter (DMT)-like permease
VAGATGFSVLVALPYGPSFSVPAHVSAGVLAAMGGAALLYTAANLLIFGAAPVIGSTHFGLAFTMRVIPIALISTVLVGEKFSLFKSAGIALILAGVAYAMTKKAKIEARAAAKKGEKTKKPAYTAVQVRWGWLRAIAGTLAFGSANALDARVVQSVDTATYVPVRLLLPVLLIGTGLLLTRKKAARLDVRKFVRARRWSFAGMAVLVPVSASTFMWAVQISAQPTLLGSIHQLSLFLTILIGARVTGGESGSLKDYWAPAAICIIGVALALGLAG